MKLQLIARPIDSQIPGLTVRQPWASRVIAGEKVVEYRCWQTTYRGPLVIHAGKHADHDEDALLPRACVLGIVELVQIDLLKPKHYAWHLANPCKLRTLIPLRGALGLWPVPKVVAEQILQEIDLAEDEL